MTVLQWIHPNSLLFHVFVGQRITEMLESSVPTQWRHVSGDVNPADDASRGIPASSLFSRHGWFQGPPFTKLSELSADCWPAVIAIGNHEPADPEVTPFRWIGSTTTKRPRRIYQRKTEVSHFNRLVHIVGWLLRFLRNYPVGTEKTGLRYLSAQEIRSSTELIITVDQHNFFYRELATIRSKKSIPGCSLVTAVNPQINLSGLMRVNGRIIRSELSEPIKRPIGTIRVNTTSFIVRPLSIEIPRLGVSLILLIDLIVLSCLIAPLNEEFPPRRNRSSSVLLVIFLS